MTVITLGFIDESRTIREMNNKSVAILGCKLEMLIMLELMFIYLYLFTY